MYNSKEFDFDFVGFSHILFILISQYMEISVRHLVFNEVQFDTIFSVFSNYNDSSVVTLT